jgi:beta-glucosidase
VAGPPIRDGAVAEERIQVTGSRISRVDAESANPVVSMNRDDIERTGLTSLAEVLQELSVAGASLNQLGSAGTSFGAANINLRNLGANRVLVLVNGRPLTVGDWLESAPAVIEAWHPGIEAGHAVADVLFGTVNPGGKLPVTFPRSVGQIPIYHNHESTGRPYDPAAPDEKYVSKYLDLPDGPRFPFGYGLSYTTFATSAPELSHQRIGADALERGETVEVTVTVTNTGDRAGDEVVQLYVHDVAASIAQPVRRLRGFERVPLEPGQHTTVRFQLGADDLGFWTNDPAGTFTVEPGRIDVYTGTSSTTQARDTLTIT